tara:strand:+ start:171 stop:425 length:255 start_codon:yes stop_codon:yes gene_type:complete
MKITLAQRHLFNDSKPIMEIKGLDEKVQWDECDLSDSPPYRLKGTMTAHGKFPTYKYEELPTVFKDTNGVEHKIDDITSYMSSR